MYSIFLGPQRARSPFAFSKGFGAALRRFAVQLMPLLLAGPAWAQSAASGQLVLDTAVITGTRTPTRIDQTLSETTVIDRLQIDQATGRTLAEVLGQQAGVQFWSNGGAGKASSVSLRGLEARHTLLLIDGVRYGSATLGVPVWENIPLDSIERIEIVRGPLSGLYGSDAVGGVIQIFTRSGAPGLRSNAALTGGSNRTASLAAGVRFGQAGFEGSVQVAHSETRGFSATNAAVPFRNFNADDDGFRQNSGSARLAWRFSDGWRAEASVLSSDGQTQIDDGAGADARAGLRSQVLGLQLTGKLLPKWTTALRLSRSLDDYTTLASASTFTTLGTIDTVQKQIGWENSFVTPVGTALVLVERLQQNVNRPGTPFAVAERTSSGVAAGLNGRSGEHTWQGNLRHDRNSQFGGQTTGSLGYGYDITTAWRAAASVGSSFVQPSFNQLYYPGFGNPNLLPEEGKHGEISLRWVDAAQQLRVAYFDNRIRGYISSGPAPTNIPRIRADGVGLSYEAVWAAWKLAAALDHANPRNDSAGTANYENQLPRRARDSVKLAADTHLGAWRVGGSLAAFSHRFDNAANTTRVGGFGTLDLHADWSVAREWTLAVKLNNVGAKVYETVYGYNQPGREVFVTLRYSAQ